MTGRRAFLTTAFGGLAAVLSGRPVPAMHSDVIDALDRPAPLSSLGTRWELVTDRVMGGCSTGRMTRETVAGRPAIRLTGDVSLANNGGFVQIALDLAPGGDTLDASGRAGIALDARGNGARYALHLRSADVLRPWQSWRQSFVAAPDWRTVRLPFDGFVPHRIEGPPDLARLRRIAIVAIGRAFEADVAVAGLRFFGPDRG